MKEFSFKKGLNLGICDMNFRCFRKALESCLDSPPNREPQFQTPLEIDESAYVGEKGVEETAKGKDG